MHLIACIKYKNMTNLIFPPFHAERYKILYTILRCYVCLHILSLKNLLQKMLGQISKENQFLIALNELIALS